MKLVKYAAALVQEKDYDGLLKVKLEYETKSAKASFLWTGPQIPPDVWHQILSFFKWTYNTTKSESQVRLYVNPTSKTWDAWAYPQEARTGMSAHELPDRPTTKLQRALFPDSEGWIYFGTVHHHCDCTAFQSGVDQANEENQAGLHITVGKMASEQHDLHCRFYLNGSCFDPDMSLFWDIGKDIVPLLPLDLHDRIARHQMGKMSDMPFPEEWKANLIEIKPVVQAIGLGYFPGGDAAGSVPYSHPGDSSGVNRNFAYGPIWKRAKKAVEEIVRDAAEAGFTSKQLMDVLDFVDNDDLYSIICTNLSHYKIEFEDLKKEWPTATELSMAFCCLQIEDQPDPRDLVGPQQDQKQQGTMPTGEVWGGNVMD